MKVVKVQERASAQRKFIYDGTGWKYSCITRECLNHRESRMEASLQSEKVDTK